MKKIIFAVLFSIQVFAYNESVQGSGNSGGYCRGDGFGSYCFDQIKSRAESDATRDADLQCRIRQGTLVRYSGYCSNYCNPSYLPNDGRDTYVSCNARCRFDCQK